MKIFKNGFFQQIGLPGIFAVIVIVSAVLAVAPKSLNIARSENCSNAPTVATLNFFPVTWNSVAGYGCTDFAPIAVRNINASSAYAQSDSAQAGDELYVRIYVHNGAQQGLDPNQTTARNVRGNISVSGNTISTNFYSDNTNSVSGSVSVNVPSGATLQVVPGSGEFFDYQANTISGNSNLSVDGGNFAMGDMQACFEFSKFFRFKVKVVGSGSSAVQNPSGEIHGSVGGRVDGQCLFNGTVGWSTQNVSDALVTVSDPHARSDRYYDNDIIFSKETSSSGASAPWIAPNSGNRFTLWAVVPAGTSGSSQHSFIVSGSNRETFNVIELYETWLTAGNLDCGSAPTGNNTLTASVGGQIAGKCYFTGTADWTNSSDVTEAEITVQDVTASGAVAVLAKNTNGHAETPWLAPQHIYKYVMYNTSNGQRVKLAETSVTAPSLTCGGNNTDYNLTINKTSFCVNEVPTYTVTGDKALVGNKILWSSYFNGQTTGEIDSDYGFVLAAQNNQAYWSAAGNAWTAANIGSWRKTANVNGIKKSVDFAVRDCSNPNPTLICSPSSQQVNINQTAAFSATGGSGSYQWSALNSNQSSGSGSNFSTSYASPGLKTVTVSSGGQTVSCGVTVVSNPQTLICSANKTNTDINVPVVFTVSGGSAPYSWTSSGVPSSATGINYSAAFATSGQKTASVSSNDGQTTSCTVTVNPVVSQPGILRIEKVVENITTNSGYSHSGTAKNGDVLQYRIKIWAGSAVSLTNARVTDTFAQGLQYVAGSLKVNGSTSASGLTSGGLTFPALTQTPIEITYQATVVANSGTIINTAQVTADNASNSPQDQAMVTVTYVQPGQPALTITKQVKNVTQNTGYSSAVSAQNGDTVKYQVVVTNAGSATAKNVFVTDSNPVGVQPLKNLTVTANYSGTITSGVSLGNLAAGARVTLNYDGVVNVTSGSIINYATVSADNAATQNASSAVNVSASSNNNQNNIVYNNCVNYSCNTVTNTTNTTTYYYYINSSGNTVPSNNYSQLGITKRVRLLNSGSFQDSVSANNGDTVEFEIVVTNIGNQVVNNAYLTDSWNGNLNFISNSLQVNGSYVYYSPVNNSISLGSLYSGQQKRVTFQAQVIGGSGSIQNIAKTWGDNVSQVQDDAWVFVNSGSVAGGNVSLSYSKRANNDTKGINATSQPAAKEDYITYTLTVTNNGNSPATNFIITDDLSQVLPYADVVDNGGGSVSGNVISFPGLTVPAYGSVSKSFKVRVKYSLADNLSYVMSNTYGNTLNIQINNPQVKGAFYAPKTGADTDAFVFAGLLTAAFAAARQRKFLLKVLLGR